MNPTVRVLLVLLLMQLPTSLSQDNGTILAVPVLPPNGDPDTRDCMAGFYGRENGMIVSYQNNTDALDSLLYLHTAECARCASCVFATLRVSVEQNLHALDFEECSGSCASWRKICENEVSGISFQNLDDQSFSGIFTSFSEDFQQVFSIYPTLIQPPKKSSSKYTYHIIHGRHQCTGLLGLTIQNPYDVEIKVSFNLTVPAIAWYNGIELDRVEREVSIRCRGVLWLEPNPNDSLTTDLGGTVLTSTSPLNVFTNWAQFENNITDYRMLNAFEYNSHLVHQMPERAQWGKTFVVDTLLSKILPDELASIMRYEISIVSYSPDNTVTIESNTSSETLELREVAAAVSHEQYMYHLSLSQTEMLEKVYLKINSSSPMLVLSEAFSSNISGLESVYYSTLVQPVEWHANKQIIVLAHPLENITYHYRISITVPSNKNNHSEILESEIHSFCKSIPISRYSVRSYPIGDEYYLLVYHRSLVRSNQSQTRLLLRHGDSNTGIGVTIHAYSEDFHYSYSNGYTLGGNFTSGNDFCSNLTSNAPNAPTLSTRSTNTKIPIASGVTGSGVLAITFTLAVLLLYITWRKQRRKKLLQNSGSSNLPQSDSDYPYDIFILCADKDEEFVMKCIEKPLEMHGYRILRKNTAPNGLFALGGTIVSDIDEVIGLCAHVIVVCSENYNSKGRSECDSYSNHCKVEINCCKEKMASRNCRVIPIILDQAEDTDFVEFTQHRIRSAEIVLCSKLLEDFIKRLKRDLNIRKLHGEVMTTTM